MFWQEDEDKNLPYQVPDDVVDLGFTIKCKKLPIDHAWELSEALKPLLPWVDNDPAFAMHQIHVAETGNGWLRPEDTENELLWPSRRTKMTLRLSKQYVEQAKQQLTGNSISIRDTPLTFGAAKIKTFTNASVIFSRYIASPENEDENAFLQRMYEEIIQLTGVNVRKMICGKSHKIRTPHGEITTQHLMIADLDSEPSIKLQQYGLGGKKQLGCSLFMPHKGIKSLNAGE